MKKILALCLMLFMLNQTAMAWGVTGHRVVGLVAQKHLKKRVNRKVNSILNQNSLAEVSNWMDDIKSDTAYKHTHDWHWVTILSGETYEQSTKNSKGDVIMKIEELVATLKAGGLSAAQEETYLKYLVHLVGDMHQPLHIGDRYNQGGNQVRVTWFGQNSNLHRVWDSDLIEQKSLSYSDLAGFLDEPTKETRKMWQKMSVREWAAVSQSHFPQIYDFPADGKLGYRYSYDNFNTVQTCLMQAGIHLAGLLNEIYG
ncbi:MAG: S1/P1 nuclease [Spirosomaceae bacterium]|nr:S1/P1 nuclease [Spirosomataceae bacterium]